MQSAKSQTTTPLEFLIIICNLCECLDSTNQNHYPVFGKWRHWMALTAGRFRRCWGNKNDSKWPLKFRLPTKQSTCTKQTPTRLPTYLPTYISPCPLTLPTHSPTYISTHPFTFLHSYLPSTYHPCTSVLTYLARLKYIVPYDHFTGRNSSSCGIEGKRSRARAKFWVRFIRKWSCIFFGSWLEIIFLYWIMKLQWI